MLSACRRDPNTVVGARDAAVLAVMAATGARRTEIASIERQRLDLDELVVELRVKGGGWRTAALHPAAAEYLRIWMSYGVNGNRVFCPVQKDRLVLSDQPIGDHANRTRSLNARILRMLTRRPRLRPLWHPIPSSGPRIR